MMRVIRTIAVSVVLLTLLSGTACQGTQTNSSLSNSNRPIRIQFWDENAGENRTPYYRELLRRFKAQNPDIDVEYVGIPASFNKQKYDVAISSNNMPDIAAINSTWIAEFASKEVLLPLDSYFEHWEGRNQIGSSFIQFNRSLVPDQKLYQIPNTFYMDLFWYRSDWFAEAGLTVPQTWEAFFDDVKSMNYPRQRRYGYSLRGGDGSINQLTPIMYAYSGISDYFTAEGKCTINDPKNVEFLKKYVSLYRTQTPISDIVKGYKEMVDTFDSGESSMIQHNFGSYNDHLKSLGADHFAGMLFPPSSNGKRVLVTVANGYGIFRSSAHPDAAWRLLSFLLSAESQAYWNQRIGQIPTNEDALNSESFRKTGYIEASLSAMKDKNTVILQIPSYLPDYTIIVKQQLEPNFQKVLSGMMSVEDFLNGWASVMEQSYANYVKKS